MMKPNTETDLPVKAVPGSSFFSRNARFLWLATLLATPGIAFFAYVITPHEAIWHEVLYSLLCLPLFFVWLVALFGCVLSFLIHRTMSNA
jgi:hypothetical protein